MTLNPAPPLSVMSCLLVIINEIQVKVSVVPQRTVVDQLSQQRIKLHLTRHVAPPSRIGERLM